LEKNCSQINRKGVIVTEEQRELEAYMRIIELADRISGLAWNKMAPDMIRSYAQEIVLQVSNITGGKEK